MAETDVATAETWERLAPQLSLSQLNNLERDGVHIQCLNSSDFVIGRQTNFNGPVTIITCAEVLRQRNHEEKREDNKEDVVIRDKVLSQSAALKVQKLATEQPGEEETPKVLSRFEKYKKPIWMFVPVCVGLLVVASVTLAVLPTTSTGELLPKCTSLTNNSCIYSDFDWGGRRNTSPLKPLRTPVPYVIISQTYEDFCYDIPMCLKFVKLLQVNTTDETACNFLSGGDGNVYKDRGWDRESFLEEPTAGKALQICFMGNHSEEDYPTYPQVVTTKKLIEFGVENNYISKNYTLTGSNATSPKKYLGSIYNIIKKWPNFSEDPFSRQDISPDVKNMTNPNPNGKTKLVLDKK